MFIMLTNIFFVRLRENSMTKQLKWRKKKGRLYIQVSNTSSQNTNVIDYSSNYCKGKDACHGRSEDVSKNFQ